MVVEDERDIATFLRAYFRASGKEVIHLDPTSPDEVATAVATHRPTCVLLDLKLRGFNGLEAFRRMRDAGEPMPVIVVTADANPATEEAALDAGVVAVVRKPFSVDELCRLVARHTGDLGDLGDLDGPAALQSRLAAEVAKARDRKPVSFALVRMVTPPATGGLGSVARGVQGALPASAFVANNDGGELGVILPGVSVEAAEATLAAALGTVAPPGVVRAGLASCPNHAADRDELYMAADAALAEACDANRLIAVAV
jgi:CheY-like chemotaxis protein